METPAERYRSSILSAHALAELQDAFRRVPEAHG